MANQEQLSFSFEVPSENLSVLRDRLLALVARTQGAADRRKNRESGSLVPLQNSTIVQVVKESPTVKSERTSLRTNGRVASGGAIDGHEVTEQKPALIGGESIARTEDRAAMNGVCDTETARREGGERISKARQENWSVVEMDVLGHATNMGPATFSSVDEESLGYPIRGICYSENLADFKVLLGLRIGCCWA